MGDFGDCWGFQVGDVALSVPDSLVVTLERVLGNETVGMVVKHLSGGSATSCYD